MVFPLVSDSLHHQRAEAVQVLLAGPGAWSVAPDPLRVLLFLVVSHVLGASSAVFLSVGRTAFLDGRSRTHLSNELGNVNVRFFGDKE